MEGIYVMSENFADLQLSFDFADTENTNLHGGRQIAAPVDDSLLEDDEEDTSSPVTDDADDLNPSPAFDEFPEPELPESELPESSSELADPLSAETPVIPDSESATSIEQLSTFPEALPQEPAEEPAPPKVEPQPILPEQLQEAQEALPQISQIPQIPQEPVVQKFVYSEFSRKEPVEEAHPAPEPVQVRVSSRPVPRQPLVFQRELQRAALAWLASGFPTAAATRVPTRLIKFRADAAAFWSTPGKNRLLQPERTVLVEARATRSSCWPECSGSEEIVPQLRLEQERRQAIEAEIRIREPHLRDSDVLFPEIEYWNYSGTKNPEYKLCLRKIRDYERALYRGSRFERIRRANVANELYLAVPEGLIHPNELAEGWGLLYVSRNLSVTVAKRALPRECPQENMLHLSQNIAASSLNDVLFAHGVYLSSSGKISFRRPPRRRRLEHFL